MGYFSYCKACLIVRPWLRTCIFHCDLRAGKMNRKVKDPRSHPDAHWVYGASLEVSYILYNIPGHPDFICFPVHPNPAPVNQT